MLARETDISNVLSSLRMLNTLINDIDLLSKSQKKLVEKSQLRVVSID